MSLKIEKIIVTDDETNETQELNVLDTTLLAICEGESEDTPKVLSNITTNAKINMELLKLILEKK